MCPLEGLHLFFILLEATHAQYLPIPDYIHFKLAKKKKTRKAEA